MTDIENYTDEDLNDMLEHDAQVIPTEVADQIKQDGPGVLHEGNPYELIDDMLMDSRTGTAQELHSELFNWWMETAENEIAQLEAKAKEYGGGGRANDLIEIGRAMVEAGVAIPDWAREDPAAQDQYLTEIGIYFYIRGKMARWAVAVAEGRPVSDDTLLDIGVYVRMVQRSRFRGGWPE